MKTHWIGIIKWNDGTILRTEPFYKYDEGIKVWSSKFSFENTGKFEWIDYERVEEPKQETVFENAKLTLRKHILENKEQVIKDLDEMREQSNKYETLEEAALNYSKQFLSAEDSLPQCDFKKGAEWQADRMYSEEDMIAFMQFIISQESLGNTSSVSVTTAKYYLEQFKKK